MRIAGKKVLSKQFSCVFAGIIPACFTLAVLILTGANVRGGDPATQSPADAHCVIDDKMYRDYIVGLGDAVNEIYTQCQGVYEYDYDSISEFQETFRLGLSASATTTMSEPIGALEQLRTAVCEVETLVRWLELADGVNELDEIIEDGSFLLQLADASVTALHSKLEDLETCAAFQPPTSPAGPLTEGASPAGSTTEALSTAPPCSSDQQYIQPLSDDLDDNPLRLVAILDEMRMAVVRLDAVVKRDFS